MKLIFELAMLWSSISLSRFQCVLEKEYFCSSIPNAFPEGLTSVLFVVTNLGVINATVFSSPNLNSVTSLALPNSGITRIEPGAFQAFRSLTKLSLYQNSLRDVSGSWLLNPGRLENLTMAQNLIAEIRSTTFFGFSNLSALNLANNKIHWIASESFKDLTKLMFVDLSGNNLTTLTRKIFSGLVSLTVKLGGSPWNCSCDLQDFGLYLQELKNASQLEDAESVLCRSPPRLEGVPVWNVSDLNCSLNLPPSTFENSFPKVGLPALLACVVFISFVLLLIFIWISKTDRKVQPRKEATGLATSAQPHSHITSTTDPRQSHENVRAMEADTSLRSRMSAIHSKSAAAILLRTDFHQGQPQSVRFAGTKPEPPMPPCVATNDQSFIGSEDFCNFMKWWHYHKLKEGRGEGVPSSYLTEVQMETSGMKQKLQEQEKSGAPEDDEDVEGRDSFENPEPFLYLSIATATEEAVDEDLTKDVMIKDSGSHLASLEGKVPLKRSLTWPYEPSLLGHKSNKLSIRNSFVMQFFLHTLAPGELGSDGELERYEKQLNGWSGKEPQGGGDDGLHHPEVNKEARLDRETESPGRGEAAESVNLGGLELDEGLKGQRERQGCPRKDDQVYDGRVELNTKQAGLLFQPGSEAAGVRSAPAWQSRTKVSKHFGVLKSKESLKPASSRSRPRHEIQPSLPLAGHVSPTRSGQEEALAENDEWNYVNLLYEVVENRGRWTRERWKQTHRTSAPNDRLAKFK